jgi:hypothetical protein
MPEQRVSGFSCLGERGNKKKFATVEYYVREDLKKEAKCLNLK